MAFQLQHRLCVGEHVVPLAKQQLELKDLHELQSGDEDPQDFLLLSLKVGKPMPSMLWFTKSLGLPSSWWEKNGLGNLTTDAFCPLVYKIRVSTHAHAQMNSSL